MTDEDYDEYERDRIKVVEAELYDSLTACNEAWTGDDYTRNYHVNLRAHAADDSRSNGRFSATVYRTGSHGGGKTYGLAAYGPAPTTALRNVQYKILQYVKDVRRLGGMVHDLPVAYDPSEHRGTLPVTGGYGRDATSDKVTIGIILGLGFMG